MPGALCPSFATVVCRLHTKCGVAVFGSISGLRFFGEKMCEKIQYSVSYFSFPVGLQLGKVLVERYIRTILATYSTFQMQIK